MIVGALPLVGFVLTTGNWFTLIFLGVYLVIATPTVYSRFSGINL